MGKSTSTKIAIPNHNPQWDRWSYRIGCPVWGCKTWTNEVYPIGAKPDEILSWYSQMFPTVEGNSTFYAMPPKTTFEKWRDQSASTFRFCFKFPKAISHDAKLVGIDELLATWLDRLNVLYEADRLGPTFLQLPPSFSFRYFEALASFLRRLPRDWPWAVEVRHMDWFDQAEKEEQLDTLLRDLRVDRVLFDSSPLNAQEASDEFEQASQQRKPKSPFRTTVTAKRPMLRLIGRNNAAEIAEPWANWAEQIANWIQEGYEPWIFTHAPDDTYAPGLARLLHEMIRLKQPSLLSLPTLGNVPGFVPPIKQLDLF
jgi:uncharacterized protein YecE (DUF72 family)